MGKGRVIYVNAGKGKSNGGTIAGAGCKGVGVNAGHGKAPVNMSTGPRGKPVIGNVHPGLNSLSYKLH